MSGQVRKTRRSAEWRTGTRAKRIDNCFVSDNLELPASNLPGAARFPSSPSVAARSPFPSPLTGLASSAHEPALILCTRIARPEAR